MYIDKYKTSDGYEMDGILHRTAGFLIAHQLNFCACGEPIETVRYVGEILQGIKERKEAGREILSLFPNDQIAYFILYTLDQLGLIEHGTLIDFAWLTQEGKEMLSDILELKDEEE